MGAGCCGGNDGPAKPTPTMNEQQNEIAKWLRWNVKVKNAPVKGKRAYRHMLRDGLLRGRFYYVTGCYKTRYYVTRYYLHWTTVLVVLVDYLWSRYRHEKVGFVALTLPFSNYNRTPEPRSLLAKVTLGQGHFWPRASYWVPTGNEC